MFLTVKLKPHQTEALRKIKNGSILKGGVGTGKSITALAYFFIGECQGTIPINGFGELGEMKTPKDLYIITTAKKRNSREWLDEITRFRLSTNQDVSFGNVKVTIDSWNNILNYTEVRDAFFIFDEQRLVGSGAWVKAFLKIAKHNRWIVLSATPGDIWMDYIPVFVANGFYKNRTEFVRSHVVFNNFTRYPKIERYIEVRKLEFLRNQVVIDMPFDKHTKPHVINMLVDHNKELFDRVSKDRWHIYEERPIKDVSEFFAVARKLVNSDVSRLAAIMEVMEKHPRLIIFYNFNYELEMLRVLGKTIGITTHEYNGHKHQDVPTTEKWLYLVQYNAGSEAWECTSTDAMAFWSLNYSYRVMEQCKGRIDRLNTPFTDLYYYILRSTSPMDQAITKALATKRTFNEKKYIESLERAA